MSLEKKSVGGADVETKDPSLTSYISRLQNHNSILVQIRRTTAGHAWYTAVTSMKLNLIGVKKKMQNCKHRLPTTESICPPSMII